jgi:FkbM family methyltransferase
LFGLPGLAILGAILLFLYLEFLLQAMDRLKSLALTALPEGLLRVIKLRHYAHTVRAAPVDYEPDLRVVRALVQAGEQVVDIGANIGIYTKHLSQFVGPAGHLYSFEPVPLTFDILRSNVKRLQLHNVDLFQIALSDTDGESSMEIPEYPTGGEDYYMARIVDGSSSPALRTVPIQLRTLDSVLPPSSAISFIKCDVEGHELRCLRGSIETIRSSRPAWLVEVSGNPDAPGSNAEQTLGLLRDFGYAVYLFDGTRLRARETGDHSVNYFFLTPPHLERLQGSGFLPEG